MINQFVDTTGTTLNQYTLKEDGQADKTVQLVFNPSVDAVIGTQFNASTMNPIINQVNDNETALNGLKLWCGTQAEYDALTPTNDTLYFIKES